WGDYKREKSEQNKIGWQRYQRRAIVDGIPVGTAGPIGRIELSPSSTKNPRGVVVTGVDDLEICMQGIVNEFLGYRAVSLFLVNRRTKGALGDRTKDERWILQPELRVTAADGKPIFVAKDFQADIGYADPDGENAISGLLYRHAREFATGHGVAVGWDAPV